MKALLEQSALTVKRTDTDPTAKATVQIHSMQTTRSILKAEERTPAWEKWNSQINEMVNNAISTVRSTLFPYQLVPAHC